MKYWSTLSWDIPWLTFTLLAGAHWKLQQSPIEAMHGVWQEKAIFQMLLEMSRSPTKLPRGLSEGLVAPVHSRIIAGGRHWLWQDKRLSHNHLQMENQCSTQSFRIIFVTLMELHHHDKEASAYSSRWWRSITATVKQVVPSLRRKALTSIRRRSLFRWKFSYAQLCGILLCPLHGILTAAQYRVVYSASHKK